MTHTKFISMSLLACIVTAALGFSIGESKGIDEGFAKSAKAYDFWAQSFLYRDPRVRLDAIMMVPAGAKVSQPKCHTDEEGFMLLHRRPERVMNTETVIRKIPGYWTVDFPSSDKTVEPLGAAQVGCRKLNERVVTDLTKNWELPSNLE